MTDKTATPPAPPIPLIRPAAAAPVDLHDDDNPHKLVARYRKARKIAVLLLAHGANAEAAESLNSDIGRKVAAQAADVNVPSETTWALVVELVREVRP
jgi:hypothetical protein